MNVMGDNFPKDKSLWGSMFERATFGANRMPSEKGLLGPLTGLGDHGGQPNLGGLHHDFGLAHGLVEGPRTRFDGGVQWIIVIFGR